MPSESRSASSRKRLAVAAEERADARIAQAFELPPVIVDVGPEPGAGIGDGEQRLAGRVDDERRIAAEEGRSWRRD